MARNMILRYATAAQRPRTEPLNERWGNHHPLSRQRDSRARGRSRSGLASPLRLCLCVPAIAGTPWKAMSLPPRLTLSSGAGAADRGPPFSQVCLALIHGWVGPFLVYVAPDLQHCFRTALRSDRNSLKLYCMQYLSPSGQSIFASGLLGVPRPSGGSSRGTPPNRLLLVTYVRVAARFLRARWPRS
jgi:hypothetical protein